MPDRRRGARRLLALNLYGLIFAVTMLLFLYVSEQVGIVSLERGIHDMERETETLTAEVEQLRIEASNLKKGSRIKEIATSRLGLVMPEGLPATLF